MCNPETGVRTHIVDWASLARSETVPAERRKFPSERDQTGVVGGAPICKAPRPSHVPPVGMHIHEHALAVRRKWHDHPVLRCLDAPLPLPDWEH
jgi:hypothetical protein